MRPILIAVVLLIAGPSLHFYAPRHRLSVEERVRERTMSATEARWHRRFLRFWAPALTVLGLAQACLLLVQLLR